MKSFCLEGTDDIQVIIYEGLGVSANEYGRDCSLREREEFFDLS